MHLCVCVGVRLFMYACWFVRRCVRITVYVMVYYVFHLDSEVLNVLKPCGVIIGDLGNAYLDHRKI